MLEFRRNPRPARCAFPVPEQLETLAVPTDEGSGRHDRQRAFPIEPAAEPHERQACWMGDPARPDSAFPVECELFAQEEILCRERAFRPYTENQKTQQIGKEVQAKHARFYHGPMPSVPILPIQDDHNLARFKPVK